MKTISLGLILLVVSAGLAGAATSDEKTISTLSAELMAKVSQLDKVKAQDMWSIRTDLRKQRLMIHVRKNSMGYTAGFRKHGSGRFEVVFDAQGVIKRTDFCGPARSSFERESVDRLLSFVLDAALAELDGKEPPAVPEVLDNRRRAND
ncbi:hypothetical protein JW905_05930 [bacterium]|nr:hypothetical protein [candidate division CSSED10-310 bacterium]